MADPQQGQQPMSEQSGIGGIGTNVDPAAQFRAYMMAIQQQQQLAPSLAHTQTQVQPFQREQKVAGGSDKQRSMQNFGASLQNLVGTVTQKIQERKATQQQHVFDRFTQAVQGIQSAQAALKENPQDERAQQALKINQAILDAMFNGPHGEKHSKMLSKGFGIDDKNAQTPERQAAIQAVRKSMGVGAGAAGLISQLPQTLQPIPGQPQMKAPTGDALIRAQTAAQGQQNQMAIAKLRTDVQREGMSQKNAMFAEMHGLKLSKDSITGQPIVEAMSPEERSKVPYLKAQDDFIKAKTDLDRVVADARGNPDSPEMKTKIMDAYSKRMDAEARMIAARAAQTRALIAQVKEPPEVAAARKSADQLETEYAKAQQYVKTPSPTNDTALIFSYVRAQVAGAGRMTNTEIQQALKSGSFGTRISNMYNRATKGELDPDFRAQAADSIRIAAEKARLTADKYDVQKEKEGGNFDELQKALEDLAH